MIENGWLLPPEGRGKAVMLARNVYRHLNKHHSNGWRWAQTLHACALDRRVRKAGRCFILFSLYLTSLVPGLSAQNTGAVPDIETIIAGMARARDENQALFRPYVVTRDYKLFGKERDKTKSQVIADVTFVPPDLKKYVIQQTNGTGLGEKLVRRMLASEAEITKDNASTDISPRNYDFRFVREEDVDGQRCYVLELLPRRKDRNLLRGSIWVDAGTYLLRRTEGEPAKSPSWWVRDVRIALVYSDVGGMWLQTGSEATANVRLFGQYTIVSRDLRYTMSESAIAESSARPLD